MKLLERNKTIFYYALFQTKVANRNSEGNLTGEYTLAYSNPILSKANISSARGTSDIQQFGIMENYDRVIVTESTDITESSILWIDTLPVISANGTTVTPHDYVVKQIAKSLNSVSIAIAKVRVS